MILSTLIKKIVCRVGSSLENTDNESLLSEGKNVESSTDRTVLLFKREKIFLILTLNASKKLC